MDLLGCVAAVTFFCLWRLCAFRYCHLFSCFKLILSCILWRQRMAYVTIQIKLVLSMLLMAMTQLTNLNSECIAVSITSNSSVSDSASKTVTSYCDLDSEVNSICDIYLFLFLFCPKIQPVTKQLLWSSDIHLFSINNSEKNTSLFAEKMFLTQ